LVTDGLADFQPVGVLRDTTDGIWVTGLEDNVDVIVVGQEFVTDGVAVDATFQEATQ
jgi:multidrug efflux system membrane fusion protein